MGKGKNFENRLTNELDRGTGDTVNVYPVGYSGSHATSAEDLVIADASTGLNYSVELKRASSDYCRVDEDELEALVERQNGMTVVALVVSFTNRETMVVRYFDELTGGQTQVDGADEYNDMSVAEKFAVLVPDAFDPRVTDSGTLALTRPSLDGWPSATAGSDDADAVLSGLGIRTEKSVEVE